MAQRTYGRNYVEETESAKLEPSFVGRIHNQTVNVGRDVILGCQVQNLGPNYKVSFLRNFECTQTLKLYSLVATGLYNYRGSRITQAFQFFR